MPKTRLEPLTVRFHEPDSGLLYSAVDNEKWQLQYMQDSLAVAVTKPSKVPALSSKIREKKKSIRALEKEMDILHNWRIQLSPYVDSLELISLYQEKNLPIPADIKQWSKKFDFFQLAFGGDIFVEKGMKVKKLEMGILFDAELSKRARHSIAYSIFPTNEWKKYGQASIAFGLTGDLGFQIPLAPTGLPFGKIGDLGPQLKGQFLLGPFVYSFKKAVITGVGKGNYSINWVIEKGDILSSGEFETRVVLQVPRNRDVVKTKVSLQATVTPPGFWKRLLGKTRLMAPDNRTYEIALS